MQLMRSWIRASVVVFLLIPVISLHVQSGGEKTIFGDLVVGGNDVRVIDRDIVIQGNIIVRDNAVLVITGSEMEILQYSANEFGVFVQGNATLNIQSSRVFSDYPLDVIMSNNSKLQITSSRLETKGTVICTGRGVEIRTSILSTGSMSISAPFTIAEGIMSGNLILNTPGTITNTTVSGQILVSSLGVRLVNVMTGSLQVTGNGEVKIHHWLQARVNDAIGLPMDGVNVTLRRYPGGETVEWRLTLNGSATFIPVSDTITASGISYEGNYTLYAEYQGSNSSYPVVLPPFKPGHPQTPITYGYLELPVMAGYRRGAGDLSINGVERVISGSGGEISIYLQGNLVVENGGRLILKDGCRVFIDQSRGRSGVILDSGMIELRDNSSIDSNMPMGIYLKDGMLHASDSSLNASIGGTGSSEVNLTRTGITGAVKGSFTGLTLRDVHVGSISTSSSRVMLSGVMVSGDANITSQNITLSDLDVKGRLILSGVSRVHATSIRFREISVPEGMEVYRYWHVTMLVTNGNDRPVPGANVDVYYLMGTGSLVASGVTDTGGMFGVDLLGDVISPEGRVFAGNYTIKVSFSKQGSVHNKSLALAVVKDTVLSIRFAEKVIPPFSISVVARTEPESVPPGGSFYVRGEVRYNGGPDPVPDARVSILLLEDGRIIHNTTANAQGIFSMMLSAPEIEGEYTIEVDVYDPATGFTNYTSLRINVRPVSMMVYVPWVVIGVILVILIILSLLILRRKRAEKIKEQSRRMMFDEILVEELRKMDAEKSEKKKEKGMRTDA